ncbi:MAG TPA: preprotein translocase subunit YajC [Thermoanaerobaculia bacterium]|nr:preprotein translocase subunit YajC [Thermoanaerobaculia bacterium]
MSPCLWLALQAQPTRNPSWGLVPYLAMFVIFYLVLILPMRKRQKALQQTIETLKRGDRVVTSSGIFGEVYAIEGSSVTLKVADNVRIRFAKTAIAGLEADEDKGGSNA